MPHPKKHSVIAVPQRADPESYTRPPAAIKCQVPPHSHPAPYQPIPLSPRLAICFAARTKWELPCDDNKQKKNEESVKKAKVGSAATLTLAWPAKLLRPPDKLCRKTGKEREGGKTKEKCTKWNAKTGRKEEKATRKASRVCRGQCYGMWQQRSGGGERAKNETARRVATLTHIV